MSKNQNKNGKNSACDCGNDHNHNNFGHGDHNHCQNCNCGEDNKHGINKNSCNCENDCDGEVMVSICDDSDSEAEIQKKRADEMIYQAQRIQAEFDNYRRRTAELNKQIKEDGRIEVIEKLIPALDAFNQAAKVITDQNTLQGINMIYDRIMAALSGFGLKIIDSIGKEFNPNLHEAVMVRQDNSQAGTIIEVLQEGYSLNGRTLRAAMVITAG